MKVPEFIVFTQTASPGYWSPEIISYNESPYMLTGSTATEVLEAIAHENELDELPEFRVVNTISGSLFRVGGFGRLVEILPGPTLTNPADVFFLQEIGGHAPFNG